MSWQVQVNSIQIPKGWWQWVKLVFQHKGVFTKSKAIDICQRSLDKEV